MDIKKILFLLIFIFTVSFASCLFKQRTIKEMTYQISNEKELLKLFPQTPEQIKVYAQQCMKDVSNLIQEILNVPSGKRTFDNTMRNFDKISFYYTPVSGTIHALESLSPNKEIRDTAKEVLLELSNFLIDNVGLNIDLYKAVKDYAEVNSKKENLTEKEKYFIKEAIDDYKRNGLDLPKDKLEELRKIYKKLKELSLEFETNIAQHKCEVIVTLKELDGLSKNFIDSLPKDKNGNYILGCDYPTYFNVMENCKVEETRKKLFLAFSNRAYPQNMQILDAVIENRAKVAKLLGFKSFSHLSLENKMAKNPENVRNFLNGLIDKAKVKAKKELEIFKKDLPESVKLVDGKIKPWDFKFLKNYYKQKYLDLDNNKISEYFELENTLKELLNIYEKFFSIKFVEKNLKGFWHEDVKLVEVYDQNKNLLGYLLLDLFPRDNKYSHAAQMTIISSIKTKEGMPNIALCVVMANFPKPTKDQPALLKYNDVVTFFHEFGHALHSILGRTELYSQSGTHVKTDFVEMPSQMLENWLKDKEILKIVSKHYKNGENLPENMIEKIINLERFDSGDMVLRQSYYAFLSLDYFDEIGQNRVDTQAISEKLFKNLIPYLLWVPEDHVQANFGHLMGYGASYYGYLWSNVFAKDLFNQIKKRGLLDPKMGQKYTIDILSQGGSQDPNSLIKTFLGREPNQEAFLKDLGLS